MAAHRLCVAHRYDTANLQKNIQTPKVKAALCGMRLLRKRHAVATKKASNCYKKGILRPKAVRMRSQSKDVGYKTAAKRLDCEH